MFKVSSKVTRMTPMTTYFTTCSSVFIVNFEQANVGWGRGSDSFLFLEGFIEKQY